MKDNLIKVNKKIWQSPRIETLNLKDTKNGFVTFDREDATFFSESAS